MTSLTPPPVPLPGPSFQTISEIFAAALHMTRARELPGLLGALSADHQGHREGPYGLRWGLESISTQLSELGVSIAPST